nr:GNAT family N-acetyltransferase [Macrococcus goetzii]
MMTQLNDPHSEFYFALIKEQVAGYLKINTNASQTENITDNSLEIDRIYVDKNFQKQGIGKHLYEKAV